MEKASPGNGALAKSCRQSQAVCCKKGQLFITLLEYQRIMAWLATHRPAEISQFQQRCVEYDDFFLYDQRDQCQFLNNKALCVLHETGNKPAEYFWWPFHVYYDNHLEIKVAHYCCAAGLKALNDNDHIETVEKQARQIGLDVLKRFRMVFSGNPQGKISVRRLKLVN